MKSWNLSYDPFKGSYYKLLRMGCNRAQKRALREWIPNMVFAN